MFYTGVGWDATKLVRWYIERHYNKNMAILLKSSKNSLNSKHIQSYKIWCYISNSNNLKVRKLLKVEKDENPLPTPLLLEIGTFLFVRLNDLCSVVLYYFRLDYLS